MGNSGFVIVLIVVIVAIAAGFLYSEVDQLSQQNATANAALAQTAQRMATAEAKATEMVRVAAEKDTKIAQLEEALKAKTAEKAVCEQQNKILTEKLDTHQNALAGPAQPQAASLAFAAMNSAQLLSFVQPDQLFTWLPMLAIGLFGTVVVTAYRILRAGEQPEPAGQRQAPGDRMATRAAPETRPPTVQSPAAHPRKG